MALVAGQAHSLKFCGQWSEDCAACERNIEEMKEDGDTARQCYCCEVAVCDDYDCMQLLDEMHDDTEGFAFPRRGEAKDCFVCPTCWNDHADTLQPTRA